MPTLPKKNFIRRILPPAWQKEYWRKRLRVRFSNGCYDSICESLLPKIPKKLQDGNWTETEVWILETLVNNWKADEPEWVAEIREKVSS